MLTTIEVVVDERAYRKGIGSHAAQEARRDKPVALRIPWQETELRAKVKSAGARWSPQLKLRLLRRDKAVALGIAERIVEGAAEQCEDVDISYQI